MALLTTYPAAADAVDRQAGTLLGGRAQRRAERTVLPRLERAVRVVFAELLSQCLLCWEARSMVKGTVIAESLQIGAELRIAGLRLTRLSRQDFSKSVTAAQPAVWTIVDFEADDDVADELSRSLAQSLLAEGGWYADFRAGQDHVVVFADRIFRYRRGDHAVILRPMDEKAAIKSVFATMIRAAGRWCRVSITDLERHQLRLLRAELELDPPPATTEHKPVTSRSINRSPFTGRCGLDRLCRNPWETSLVLRMCARSGDDDSGSAQARMRNSPTRMWSQADRDGPTMTTALRALAL